MELVQSTSNVMSIDDPSLFDCFEFEDQLNTIPPLQFSEVDAFVPFPTSFDDHWMDISNLSSNNFDATKSLLPLVPENYYRDLPPLNELSFDYEINLDSFSWDDNLSIPRNPGSVPLNTVDDDSILSFPFEAKKNLDYDDINEDEHDVKIERRINGRLKLGEIGLDEIKSYFYMPITRAAKEMNVGVTLLKKRCRELGILRWPHRKMKSLNTLIRNVQELGKGSNEECIKRELESLEEHRRLMEENPELELTERTKKLRQACFKANYKRRRAMQHPYFDPLNASPY
ncbi:uncharacterized protein A4U43_C05F20670 [Asparagus officinalis]|uniref:RWP-RK domain-containing protein n=1 Tax=Asparagus officinalis TaxID=4686 RepID=A0A5P1ET55_ASPOF|nr:protein RKD4 [Asparagus officinalis]ONK69228.1 uncharacterized protein A4U43_C05F20670 [Asparagus officinalis]